MSSGEEDMKLFLDTVTKYGDMVKKGDGYMFQCANHDCTCYKTGVGLAFTTDDIEKAEEHAKENNSTMWICKKEDLR